MTHQLLYSISQGAGHLEHSTSRSISSLRRLNRDTLNRLAHFPILLGRTIKGIQVQQACGVGQSKLINLGFCDDSISLAEVVLLQHLQIKDLPGFLMNKENRQGRMGKCLTYLRDVSDFFVLLIIVKNVSKTSA